MLLVKIACGMALLASLFALVLLKLWDAQLYAALIISILSGLGAHAATAWQPPSKSNDPAPPVPPSV